jgi:hypothetical protein
MQYYCDNDNLKYYHKKLRILSYMAETSNGKKEVYVHEHINKDGKRVKAYYRSTPKTSKGKKMK